MIKTTITSLATSLLAAGAAAAQLPALDDARVTIPYHELKTLLDAAQPAKPPAKPEPPVPWAILSARYQLALAPDHATGVAEFQVQCFRDGWTTIPLLGTEAQITGVEPADARLIVDNRRLLLLADRPGATALKLRFTVKAAPDGNGAKIALAVPGSPANSLRVTGIPEGRTLTVAGATETAAAKDGAEYCLAAGERLELAIAPVLQPPTPSRWNVGAAALVRCAENRLRYVCRLAANADSGSGLGMELRLPPGAVAIDVTGADLAEWRAAGDRVRIAWRTRDVLTREVELAYELPQPVSATEWRLRAPEAIEADNLPAVFALVVEPGLEVVAKTPPAVPLPRALAEQAGRQNCVLAGGDGAVAVKWLPLVATSPAAIETANCATRVVADGALLCETGYRVRHEASLAWKIDLPAGAELISATVDGARATPVSRGPDTIELTLPAAAPGKPTEVKLAYTGRAAGFHPVAGKLELELPRTDLLIHALEWAVAIPDGYILTALEGNVSGLPPQKAGQILLRKELCKGERPAAQIFYEKPEARK